MTEHSKIPVPRDDVSGEGAPGVSAGAGGGVGGDVGGHGGGGGPGERAPDESATRQSAPRSSLIERAAERFDFRSHMAPPPPVVAAKPVRKLGPKPVAPSVFAPVAEHPAHPALAPVSSPLSAPVSGPGAEPTSQLVPEPVSESLAQPVSGQAPQPFVAQPFEPSESPLRLATFSANRVEIDRETLRENGLIVPEGSVTALLEEFRIVKRQLMLQAAELRRGNARPMAQRVLICSPHPGEGKTYCALNLALSIAGERDSDVLLVDADFAKPSILSSLGLPGGPGLMDALMDEKADVADFVIGTDIPGLWVLPAGDTTTADSEYLSSSRTASVLDRLTQNAPNRMVIFDSPPALAASPAAELAKYVGQAVVIVRADSTGQGALEDAVSLLSACPNIQLLLNGAQFSPSGRSFGSYYGYKS